MALTKVTGKVISDNAIGPDQIGVGGIVQVVHYQTGAVATGTTIIPNDDTIPENTEGNQYMSLTITPKSASNDLLIESTAYVAHSSTTTRMVMTLFKDTAVNAIATGFAAKASVANAASVPLLKHKISAGSTSPQTFKIRLGSSSAGTLTFNGQAGSRKYGGTLSSHITITEIKA